MHPLLLWGLWAACSNSEDGRRPFEAEPGRYPLALAWGKGVERLNGVALLMTHSFWDQPCPLGGTFQEGPQLAPVQMSRPQLSPAQTRKTLVSLQLGGEHHWGGDTLFWMVNCLVYFWQCDQRSDLSTRERCTPHSPPVGAPRPVLISRWSPLPELKPGLSPSFFLGSESNQ